MLLHEHIQYAQAALDSRPVQVQPSAATVPGLVGSGLRLHLHVCPAQVRLSALLSPGLLLPGCFDCVAFVPCSSM